MAFSVEHLKLPPGKDLDILLLGISGHGKSGTGNSILRRDQFLSRGGNSSMTKEYCTDFNNIDGRCIRVVDTPGIDDTDGYSEERKKDLVINALTNSLAKCPLGYDAICLVFSYLNRFRERDVKLIEAWMALVGKEYFLSHGILVMTCGDVFVEENPHKSIQEWWEDQPNKFRWLYESCGKRCVLFHNRTKDYKVSRKQLHDLILEIDGLKTQGNTFIPSICQISEKDRERIEPEKKLISEIQHFCEQFGIIKNDLQILALYEDKDKCKRILAKIDTDFENLKKELIADGNNKIYEGIKKDFSTFEEKMSALQKLTEFPGSLSMAKRDLCEMIEKIELSLNKMIENTFYWKKLKEKTVVFFRDVLPSIIGPVATVASVADNDIATTSVVMAPVFAVVGGAVGVVALANLLYRYVYKKKKKDNPPTKQS